MAFNSNVPRRRGGGPRGGGGGFNYGPNSGGFTFRRRAGGFTPIAGPNFGAIDMSGIAGLKGRIAEANQLAANPLESQAARETLKSISIGASRRAEMERGQALGRATQTGNAGFAGALQQTAGDISARQNENVAMATADLSKEIFEQARQEGMSLQQALVAAQNEVTRIESEREQIRSEIAARNAELQAEYEFRAQQDEFEAARIAEQARQFNVSQQLDRERFGFQREEAEADRAFERERFGYSQEQDSLNRQREDSRYRDAQRETDERQRIEDQRYEDEQEYSRFRDLAPMADEEYVDEQLEEYLPGFERRRNRSWGGMGGGSGWLRPGEQSTRPGSGWRW